MPNRVRKAEINDFDRVFELFKQLWPNKQLHYLSQQNVFQRSIESKSDILICSDFADETMGFASMIIMNNFWQESRVGYITTLIVDERCRGIGLGKELLDALIREAREYECKRIELDSGFQREETHKFYERLGFVKRAFLFSLDLQEQ
jgi:ribosomal protein S18 acetylase RimI-like enzyme